MEGIEMTFTQLSNQETYLTIHEDGRIEVSENLQPSETAALVLECMRTKWMDDIQSKKIREQEDRIKRLEEAGDALANNHNPFTFIDWNKAKEAKL
jgi:hypothetical protein